MDEVENFQDNANIKAEVKDAALKAMEKLKKYYKYTDALPYTVTTSMFLFLFNYFILIILYFTNFSLVLDPRLKLQYYKEKKWENKYIEIAQNDLNNLYKTKYAPTGDRVISNECPEDGLLQHIYKRQCIINDNELDQYLITPVALYGTDILQWWKVKI